MTSVIERPRLRELRLERGWTQQEVAERLMKLAWTHLHEEVGVTGDMISKWERGTKGVSGRYRKLLAILYRVSANQLNLAGTSGRGRAPDDESLLAMVDHAAELLNQLGGAGRILRPQVLAALTDDALTRRNVLAMLDAASPTVRTSAMPTLADLDDLAARYEAAYPTAAPAALLTAVSAQLRLVDDALRTEWSAGTRQRHLRNRARVAILAGRLAGDDLCNVMAARAYFAQATDDAHQLGDQALAAIAIGYMAQLARREGQPAAALAHLRAATTLAVTDPVITSWLACLEATAHADAGNNPAARHTLGHASAVLTEPAATKAVPWFDDHNEARMAAVAGYVLLRAEDASAARQLAQAAAQLDSLGPAGRRALVHCVIDQAGAELHAGAPDTALATANRAADLIGRMSFAVGAARLRAFRDAFAQHAGVTEALRSLDSQLADLAA
jgi:transcriptional regulator with XRE-family HTH domain